MMFLKNYSDYWSLALIPLAIWSIVANILLYFPNGETSYTSNNQLTNYVWYFEGICFGGVLRLGSPVFAFLGVAFSGYSLIISSLGLAQGPLCKTMGSWDYPFKNTAGGYLVAYSSWAQCSEPANVVEWNIILFSIQIVLSALQVIICLSKAIYDLKTILCGTHSIVQPEAI
ncbi:hypothetical protein FKM82_004018 [Ascaphus truei]